MEIHPSSSIAQLISAALGGASPLLAPGVLAIAAMLAMGATHYHPALHVKASHVPVVQRKSPVSIDTTAAR